MTKDEMFARVLEVEQAGRKLLAAMDRQHGTSPFSLNVTAAREEFRRLFPLPSPDPADEANALG